jgi:hypothetical protein
MERLQMSAILLTIKEIIPINQMPEYKNTVLQENELLQSSIMGGYMQVHLR